MEPLGQCLGLSAMVQAASWTLGLARWNPVPRSSVVQRLGTCCHRRWTGDKICSGFLERIPAVECPAGCLVSLSAEAPSFILQHLGESPVEGLMHENWLCHSEQDIEIGNYAPE